ncbi:MAG: hypothetical protein QNJ56_04115 [Gammaproteobacteria bacterium]|nr:hypothetical protein [Gammaproteobacteria bacterium]
MYKKMTTLLLVLAVSLGLVACGTSSKDDLGLFTGQAGSRLDRSIQKPREATTLMQRILDDGAVLMGREETIAHLSGNTQQWSNGGAHYQESGRLDFIWDGKRYFNYSWKVRGDGKVCISNQSGYITSCSFYFKYKDTVWTVVTEEFGETRDYFGGVDTILEGKSLDALEPWDPSLSGK